MPLAATHRLAGLDGLRGLAVAMVLGYHLWPTVLPGGFVGVTLFFALSGYLITTLLLRELDRTGTIDLRAFWARRARRLLPAAVLVLAFVGVIWAVAGWSTQELRRDIAWAAVQAANWGQVAAAQTYGVDPDASPLTHYWSLAIEEQAYVIVPVLMLLARRSIRRMACALGGLVLVAVVTIVRWWDDPVVTYLATPARIGEIAFGGLAALGVHARRRAQTANWADVVMLGPRAAAVVRMAGLSAAAALVGVTVFAHLDDAWFARGAPLAAGAIASVVVTAAVTDTQFGHRIDRRPLIWLGRISYALYLVHWPLLVALRRAGVSTEVAPWATLVGSLALAAAVTRFVETPVRRGRVVGTRRRAVVALGATVAGLVLMVTALPVAAPGFDVERAAALAAERAASSTVTPGIDASGSGGGAAATDGPSPGLPGQVGGVSVPPTAGATSTADSRIRSVWMSDSTGLSLVLGIPTTTRHAITAWFTQMGCPLGRGGEVRSQRTGQARWTTAEKGCAWDEWIATSFPADGAEVAVVAFGTWDVAERRVPALGDVWTTVGDPAYDAWLLEEFRAATAALLAAGVEHVVWLTVVPDDELAPSARFEQLRELVRSHLETFDGRASVVDLAGWLARTGEIDRLLPDGAHTTFEPDGGTAAEIAERFLFPELERIVGR